MRLQTPSKTGAVQDCCVEGRRRVTHRAEAARGWFTPRVPHGQTSRSALQFTDFSKRQHFSLTWSARSAANDISGFLFGRPADLPFWLCYSPPTKGTWNTNVP